MTKNQIEYQKLIETMRANRVNEDLTRKRDEATRGLGLDTLAETARHNQQVELQARDNLAEQYRNNTAQLAELQRSHMSSEGIAMTRATTELQSLQESQRSNRAREDISLDQLDLERKSLTETQRRNLANEDLSLLSSQVSKEAAALSAQAHTAAAGISAAASQYASDNALLARQLEIDAQRYGIDINAGQRQAEIDEKVRSNIVRENEIERSNKADEAIKATSVVENVRNNVMNNWLNAINNSANIALRRQSNQIAQQQADTAKKSLDVDVALAPSRRFDNYTTGLERISSVAKNVIDIASKMKGQ